MDETEINKRHEVTKDETTMKSIGASIAKKMKRKLYIIRFITSLQISLQSKLFIGQSCPLENNVRSS